MPAAFIDESLRVQPGGPGDMYVYVVAAVVIDGAVQADAGREAARSVLLRRQLRFHWHEEGDNQRRRMLEQISGLDVPCWAFVCQPIDRRRDARARALCLSSLLWDLWQTADVDQLVLESRQHRNNLRDSRTFLGAKAAKRAHPRLAYRFARPEEEPLLWLADAVASATAADQHLELLDGCLIRVDVHR